MNEQDVARSAGFFPWVGGLIALCMWATVWLTTALGPRIAAICALAAGAYLTGGLHLDGLADTSDGLGGARGDRVRMLEIMRDSRIGAHGASALVGTFALKWAALEHAIAAQHDAWLSVPVVARFLVVVLLAFMPYAREQGLGKVFAGRVGMRELAIAAVALVPVAYFCRTAFVVPSLIGVAAALALVLRVRAILGGVTGDVLGAVIEVCETGMLLGLAYGFP